jgi:hypothetical protein
MNKKASSARNQFAALLLMLTGLVVAAFSAVAAAQTEAASGAIAEKPCDTTTHGSPYIPVDSWVYPAVMRLYALGYVKNAYLGLRPWTRANLTRILQDSGDLAQNPDAGNDNGARESYEALKRFVASGSGACGKSKGEIQVESAYTVVRGMTGTPLRDSFHLG